MTKNRATKKALIVSMLSLLLCCSMLIGSTFAWFTDSVTSKNNIIKSGNLDVVLEYRTVNKETGALTDWAVVEEDTALFSEDSLWEPGHTEYVYLRVSNAGTLALKYTLAAEVYTETEGTNVYKDPFLLSDYLMYGVVKDFTPTTREAAVAEAVNAMEAGMNIVGVTGELGETLSENSLLPGENGQPGESVETALIITMPTTVGNEANHLTGTEAPKITFGVNLYATQLMHEEDSFGDDYDEDATYYTEVSTAEALQEALNNGDLVKLAADIAPSAPLTIPAGVNVKLDLNGKTVTAPAGAICAIQNEGTLTVTGNGTIEGSYTALYSNGNLTIENGTFAATDGFGVLIDNIYGTEPSVAVINGGTFTGVGIYNPTDVTVNGGTFNVGRDPDGATDGISDEMTLFINPTFVGAPNTANVVLNGGTFNGDIYVYDDGITETVFVNNGATITGDVLDNA